MHVKVPPIKCQGIKTKLVPFILSQIQWVEAAQSKWVEPFLGSGVVAFNLAPKRALLTDTNQHLIAFYQRIQTGDIDRKIVADFLQDQGDQLLTIGADYYYEVRDRFNQFAAPLDFLFLNRSCFNGVMRFNSKGGFNVPFCRKPQRFSQSYITKIANQVDWVAKQIAGKDWEFRVADWQETLAAAQPGDFVYLDPPYIGRHTDYYNAWKQAEAEKLADVTKQLPCGFAVSMWLENQYRKNSHIQECWSDLEMHVCQHFYHVGSRETLRGAIAEALLIKPGFSVKVDQALHMESEAITTPLYLS
jgi:DNA adenine methylase